MADDVLLNKAASIERCVRRARDVKSTTVIPRRSLKISPARMPPF